MPAAMARATAQRAKVAAPAVHATVPRPHVAVALNRVRARLIEIQIARQTAIQIGPASAPMIGSLIAPMTAAHKATNYRATSTP
jgi:hypothetical protein